MENCYLNTLNCQIYQDNLIFVSSQLNLVFEYMLKNDSISFLVPPQERLLGKSLYGNVEVFDSQIYLIPFCADHMWKYCHEGGWEIVPILNKDNKPKYIMGAVRYANCMYMLGYKEAEIFKFDPERNTMKRIELDIEYTTSLETGCFGYDYEIVNEKIYVPFMCSNLIIEIDCNNDSIKTIDVPSRSFGYSGIAYDGEGFWLAPRKGKYLVYYSMDGKTKEFDLPEEYDEKKQYFGGALMEGDKVLFTSFCGKNMEFDRNNPLDIRMFGPSIYYYKKLQNGGSVISEYNGETYYVGNSGKKRKLKLCIDNQKKMKYIKENLNINPILMEGNDMGICDFLQMINL